MQKKTLLFAFKKSLPILFGYVFMGIAFGIMLNQAGYTWQWALLISTLVYAGSMQFVLVSFLAAGTALPTVALMTLLVNFRHVFYGLSFLSAFKKMGKKYYYMIFSLTDETYSVLCNCKYPKGVNRKDANFCIALFNQCYWVLGSVLGALIGQILPFDTAGIEFSMTALFLVIFMDQWKTYKNHLPALIGLGISAVSLVVFGMDNFLLPALLVTVLVLLLMKPVLQKQAAESEAAV